MKTYFLRSFFWSTFREIVEWRERGYAPPSPSFIKRRCLLRHSVPGATWIETGTYLGDTTALLARQGAMVYSIEPEPRLYESASRRFASTSNIRILHGTSESVMPTLLPQITGDVNFWLDGHYSAGVTFKGSQDTPVRDELASISQHLHRLGRVVVMVDDVRCFNPHIPEFASYPPVDFLVEWARTNHLAWQIEHDIFCAVSPSSR
jgi:hypothetical protein